MSTMKKCVMFARRFIKTSKSGNNLQSPGLSKHQCIHSPNEHVIGIQVKVQNTSEGICIRFDKFEFSYRKTYKTSQSVLFEFMP